MNRDHPDHRFVYIGWNTEKRPGNTEETCCHSNSSERQPANVGAKNS